MQADPENAGRHDTNPGVPASEKITPALLDTRLTALEAGQAKMNGVLGLMLDTLHLQTNLLRKLTEYASEQPAPSPALKILGELATAVLQMDASIETMAGRFGELSETIATAFEIELRRPTPLASNGGMM